MERLVGHEVLDVPDARLGEPHHPVVEQDQARALVAVPAEERGGDLELVVEVRAEPAFILGDDLAGILQRLLEVGPVLGEADDPDVDVARLPLEDLEPIRADHREVPGRAGHDRQDLPAGLGLRRLGDPPRRGDDLPLGQVEPDRVEPRLLVPGLMPGDERRVLPASVVDVGEDRIPVQEVRDPLVLAPPAPLVGQVDREVDLGLDRLPRRRPASASGSIITVSFLGSNATATGLPPTRASATSSRRPSASIASSGLSRRTSSVLATIGRSASSTRCLG